MADLITIPAPIYRAFKSLPLAKGKAEPGARISEFVRVGVTAYAYTLTWSDLRVLIHAAWPKPKELGNTFEGWHLYLSKEEFAALPYDSRKGSELVIFDTPSDPFYRDILAPMNVNTFMDMGERDKPTPDRVKAVNPCIALPVVKALAAMCKSGDMNGKAAPVKWDFGKTPLSPLRFDVHLYHCEADVSGLIMPVRM